MTADSPPGPSGPPDPPEPLDGSGAGVVRERYRGTDLGEVEAFLARTYTRMSLHAPGSPGQLSGQVGRLPDEPPGCWLRHDALAVPVAGFGINRMVNAVGFDARMSAGHLAVVGPRRGRMAMTSQRHGQVRTGAGEVVLAPTRGPFTNQIAPGDFDITILDFAQVANYAVHACGLPAGTGAGSEDRTGDDGADDGAGPVFTAMTPFSPALAARWQAMLTHVRDDLLANPDAAASPIILDSCSRLLISALLTTFPNTALDAAADPHTPDPTGDVSAVSEARLRGAVEFLHAHADRPLGPGEIAGAAGVPYRELAAALYRRRDTHPARLLWWARLRGANRDLRATPPPDDAETAETADTARTVAGVVAGIAARWGFADLAAFTVAYIAATGEAPEDTLRQG